MDQLNDYLRLYIERLKEGKEDSLIPLLPLFSINGEPMDLSYHYQLAPIYSLKMPKRFALVAARQIGKSYSLTARNILLSSLLPGFHTLFVQPRCDQIDRFAQSIVKPLINDYMLKNSIVNSSCSQNTRIKEFSSGSNMYFEYAFLNPDRTRGISGAASIVYDESLHYKQLIAFKDIKGRVGIKELHKINKSDNLISFSSQGNIILSRAVKDASYHGIRHCFKVTLETGQTLICTADHRLPTSIGNVRLSEIIEHEFERRSAGIEREAGADGAGYSSRGWVYYSKSKWNRKLSIQPRMEATRIQLTQAPDITRIYFASTREKTELRLRKMVKYMENTIPYSVCCFTHPDISERKKSCNPGMAGPADSGRNNLVGNGRWLSTRRQTNDSIHPWLYKRGSYFTKYMAERKIQNGCCYLQNIKQDNEKTLLYNGIYNKSHQNTYRFNKTLCSRMHVLQNILEIKNMQTVWAGDVFKRKNMFQKMLYFLLERVWEKIFPGTQRRTYEKIRSMGESSQRTYKDVGKEEILCRYREVSEEWKGLWKNILSKKSRIFQRKKSEIQRQDEEYLRIQNQSKGSSEETLSESEARSFTLAGAIKKKQTEAENKDRVRPQKNMSVLWKRIFRQTESSMLISRMRKEAYKEKKTGEKTSKKLKSSRIYSIEYYGFEPVYDIEVEGTHSYILADGFASCNCQDLNHEFLEIISECASASKKYGFFMYTGTPKTTDGTLNACWEESSMAEWCIPCQRCKHLNVASINQDLIKIISKKGIACAKCRRPINTALGHYEHMFPERRSIYAGYHISQVVHPLHCTIPSKWRDLLYKMDNYSKNRFYNEVLGEACDQSVKLLSLTDLKNASNGSNCKMADALNLSKKYESTVIGVDWSGGGELSHSYTAVAVIGITPGSDKLDCIYAERLPHGLRPEEEAQLILQYMHVFRCCYIAHDYTGAGYLREILLSQAGVPPGQIVPYNYTVMTSKDLIIYNPPSATGRYFYSLDKPRSLIVMCQMIKRQKITLPDYDSAQEVLSDLLALNEDPKEVARGNIIYLIGKKAKSSDDFAHALNFAVTAAWYSKGAYPEMAEADRFRASKDLINIMDPNKVRWT